MLVFNIYCDKYPLASLCTHQTLNFSKSSKWFIWYSFIGSWQLDWANMTEISLMEFDQHSFHFCFIWYHWSYQTCIRTHTADSVSYVFSRSLSFSIYIKPLINLSSSSVVGKKLISYTISIYQQISINVPSETRARWTWWDVNNNCQSFQLRSVRIDIPSTKTSVYRVH